MNPGRTETPENKGEKYFNDANHCYQGWQSCNGCHPGDPYGRDELGLDE